MQDFLELEFFSQLDFQTDLTLIIWVLLHLFMKVLGHEETFQFYNRNTAAGNCPEL